MTYATLRLRYIYIFMILVAPRGRGLHSRSRGHLQSSLLPIPFLLHACGRQFEDRPVLHHRLQDRLGASH